MGQAYDTAPERSLRQRIHGWITSERRRAIPSPPGFGLAAPIVFDFDDDDVGLVPLSSSRTRFDMNLDGIPDRTGWIEQGDALLALDRNQNGRIDDLSEISFVRDQEGARTDLEGLVAFDDNGDGVLDGQDEQFVQFRLWFDRNQDGRTDAGELLSLVEAGLVSISLQGTPTREMASPGSNVVYNRGTGSLNNGQTRSFMDAGFAYKALAEIDFQVSAWNSKSRAYRAASVGGQLRIAPRSAKGIVDDEAGQLKPSSLLSFSNGSFGLLPAILLDLDGDGLEARRYNHTEAVFDMDGDGAGDNTGWVSGGDGMLVVDRDGDGQITSPAELSLLAEKADAASSWDGLRTLDTNKDGKLSAGDARYGELLIWRDRNGNGVTDIGELATLSQLSISEISLLATPHSASAKLGSNLPLSTAIFRRENGLTGTVGAVALAFKPSGQPTELPPGISNDAYGERYDVSAAASKLAEAMTGFGVETAAGALGLVEKQHQFHDWIGASAS